MDTLQKFHERVEGFIAERGLTPTEFGVAALKNPNFVFRLRNGGGVNVRTMDRVNAYMDKEAK